MCDLNQPWYHEITVMQSLNIDLKIQHELFSPWIHEIPFVVCKMTALFFIPTTLPLLAQATDNRFVLLPTALSFLE